jgi:hypothetical protein
VIKKHCLRMNCELFLLGTGVLVLVCAGMVRMARSGKARAQGKAASKSGTLQHEVDGPKSILDLQPFRQVSSNRIQSDTGLQGTATLVNLNPAVNAWYLLEVGWQDGSNSFYHLENPQPRSEKVFLDPKYPSGIEISQGNAQRPCNLFEHKANGPLYQASNSQAPYASLCEGRLFLRNSVKGHRTRLEAEAEFFRTQVWGGEKVAVIFHHLLEDSHRETAKLTDASGPGGAGGGSSKAEDAPPPALIDPKYAGRALTPSGLGVTLENVHNGMAPGVWYSASGNTGVYVSLIEPQLVDRAVLESYKAMVNPLDTVEASSLCYLVAFDLERFDLRYALGTEHPSIEWSDHIQPGMKDPKLPGPDGIGTIAPLVPTGMVSPESVSKTVATFTGGFKRTHGAFKSGELATKNHGSHYGFAQDGVVFSKLQPGLATIFVLDDGSVQMKTWDTQDDGILPKIKDARQNGVPVVEFDDKTQATIPGPLVNKWGPGNWSGSEEMKLRTIRAGAALQSNGRKRFLLYAVFSDATPSAMARVFQAYRCRYAMHLDMNALEHTYLALYRRAGSQLFVDYLLAGMSEVDKTASGGEIPRFLGYPDNRDFFYVMRRDSVTGGTR